MGDDVGSIKLTNFLIIIAIAIGGYFSNKIITVMEKIYENDGKQDTTIQVHEFRLNSYDKNINGLEIKIIGIETDLVNHLDENNRD